MASASLLVFSPIMVAAAFIESTLFSKYTFTPVDEEDELLLQVCPLARK
jgi:hypothetical protein